ncbi:tRNA (adenosine(37)-N6)-threonylcarbamoyltransferase complex dimerization subunit type 1 TsaB [Bradyrhizobium sp. HKCCYLS3077]|uniref:tRNA (adenosine(37)-N6)-threonylcarbamoyltransferase complex dimerization subunit type 1 TsaB n=1 Tax=Bradyrhizobium sp. HKCCYLS3077 TaxID=3420761 RepID=UPI003EC15088
MLILAIDTALDHCAAGVLNTDSAEMIAQETLPMKRGHAEALMPLLARVMQQSGIGFADLDRIAVTTGPGSFTGLRVGLSAARGIGLAAHKPVVGVTTLSAYAAPVVSEDGASPVISAIDARHEHVYYQVVSGSGEELVPPQVAAIDDVLAAARHGAPHLVGNAAAILAGRWPAEIGAPVAVDTQSGPDIVWVAWLGAAADPAQAPARPFYLRAPDVKPPATAVQQPAQTALSS